MNGSDRAALKAAAVDEAANLIRVHSKTMAAAELAARIFDLALEEAAKLADSEQANQAAKRDKSDPSTEEWQVYNQGVFIAGRNARAIRELKGKSNG
jgi:hypothetical protein